MKKLLIIGILVIIILPMTACEEKLPTEEELITEVIQAMSGVNSYKEEMDMTMQFYVEAEEFSAQAPLSMDITGDSEIVYDVIKEESKMIMEFDITSEQEDFTMKMEMAIYIIDEMLYTLTHMPMTPDAWIKMPVPEGYWSQTDYVEMQMKLLEASEVQVLGEERRENIRCYVIQITPDILELFRLMMGQMQAPFGDFLVSDFEQIVNVFQNYSVKMWIEKDTNYLRFADVEMLIEVTPEMMGIYDEEGLLKINATMNIKAYDYNVPMDIVLPEEAAGARESFSW